MNWCENVLYSFSTNQLWRNFVWKILEKQQIKIWPEKKNKSCIRGIIIWNHTEFVVQKSGFLPYIKSDLLLSVTKVTFPDARYKESLMFCDGIWLSSTKWVGFITNYERIFLSHVLIPFLLVPVYKSLFYFKWQMGWKSIPVKIMAVSPVQANPTHSRIRGLTKSPRIPQPNLLRV